MHHGVRVVLGATTLPQSAEDNGTRNVQVRPVRRSVFVAALLDDGGSDGRGSTPMRPVQVFAQKIAVNRERDCRRASGPVPGTVLLNDRCSPCRQWRQDEDQSSNEKYDG